MDYNPILWGNQGWTFLEYVALGYPDNPSEDDKNHYKQLYKSLGYTLPCKECRMNYEIHIMETPIEGYLKNSYSLYEWVIIMQNKVNRVLNKPHKDHEKIRQKKMKSNAMDKSCCNKKKKLTEQKRMENLEDVKRDLRARKNDLNRVKEKRLEKKKRRGI